MTQPPARFGPRCGDRELLAAAFGLEAPDLDSALPCESVATGTPFLIVPLALARRAVAGAAARRRMGADRARRRRRPALPVRADERIQRALPDVRPGHGIAEDPATGGAAGPLGAYWVAHRLATPDGDDTVRLTLTQGVELGRPSELFVEVAGDTIRVAGACHPVGGGFFEF